MLFRIRVSVPDMPGALLAVTRAIADSGGNIVDIEVLASADQRAIDDLVVASEAGEDALRSALHTVPGVEVLSVRRTLTLHGFRPDLDLLTRIAGEPSRGLELLVELAPTALHADWAMAVDPDVRDGTLLHRSVGAPHVLEAEMPSTVATNVRRATVRAAGDMLWEAAAIGIGEVDVYLVRVSGPTFLQAELVKLRRIATLATALITTATVAAH